MDLTIASLAVAVLCATMLVVALVQMHGLRSSIDDLAVKVKATASGSHEPRLPSALDARLAAIEACLGNIPTDRGGGARVVRPEVPASRSDLSSPEPTPSARPPHPADDARGLEEHPLDVATEPRVRDDATSGKAAIGFREPPGRSGGIGRSSTLDRMVEAFRELIARPRKNDIARWFEDNGSLPCEATDEGSFRLVERGDGARLMILPVAEGFALVLPSALMVVDFATSFSDMLSARAAVRQVFELEADGSGTLRLIQPALAILRDGVWRLEASGHLAGLANG